MKKQIYIPSESILLDPESAYLSPINYTESGIFKRITYHYEYGDRYGSGKAECTDKESLLKLWKKIAYQIKKARENG